jgi:tetratricopeptide (TPR) repeat protein
MSSGAEPPAPEPRADVAEALRAEGRFADAAIVVDAAIERFAREGRVLAVAQAKLARGVLAHDLGDHAAAEELLTQARSDLLAAQRPEAVAVCAFDLAIVLHDLGRLDDALDRLVEARTIFESLGRPLEVAGCNQNLGVVLHALGRDAEARTRLLAARAGFAAAGRDADVAECDHDLAVLSRLRPAPQVGLRHPALTV